MSFLRVERRGWCCGELDVDFYLTNQSNPIDNGTVSIDKF